MSIQALKNSLVGSFPLKISILQSTSAPSHQQSSLAQLAHALSDSCAETRLAASDCLLCLCSVVLHLHKVREAIPVDFFVQFLRASIIPGTITANSSQSRLVLSAIRLALALLYTTPGYGLSILSESTQSTTPVAAQYANAIAADAELVRALCDMAISDTLLPEQSALAFGLLSELPSSSSSSVSTFALLHPKICSIIASNDPKNNLVLRSAVQVLLAMQRNQIPDTENSIPTIPIEKSKLNLLAQYPDPIVRCLTSQLITTHIKISPGLCDTVNPIALQVMHALITDFTLSADAVRAAVSRLPTVSPSTSTLGSPLNLTYSFSSPTPSTATSNFLLPSFESDLGLDIAPRPAFILANLLKDNPALQLAADDLRVWSVLFPPSSPPKVAFENIRALLLRYRAEIPEIHDWTGLDIAIRQLEGVLSISATLMFYSETHRQRAVDIQLLPLLHLILSENIQLPGLRLEAMQCMRSLTRSVSILKLSITDLGLDQLLYSVLGGENEDIKVLEIALMAGSNIVCQYDPAKTKLAESGALRKVLRFVSSSSYPHAIKLNSLRLAAMFAHKADVTQCKLVLELLPFSEILRLNNDSDVNNLHNQNAAELKEKAMHLLCNISSTSPEHGMLLVDWVGCAVMDPLAPKEPQQMDRNVLTLLQLAGHSFYMTDDLTSLNESTTLHSLGVIAALALCNGQIRNIVLQEMCSDQKSSLKWILNFFGSKSKVLRIRCLWIVLNLLETAVRQQSLDSSFDMQHTGMRLKEAGYEKAMDCALFDDDGEIREIAKAVREHLTILPNMNFSRGEAIQVTNSDSNSKRPRIESTSPIAPSIYLEGSSSTIQQ